MTKVFLPILLAGTVLATWLAYLAGYSAGEREQKRQTLLDIEVLRRAEDDRVQPVDPYLMWRQKPGETYDEWLVLDDMRVKRDRYGAK